MDNQYMDFEHIENFINFQYNLGWYYYNNKSILQALYYFQLAANNNHIKAKKMMDILTPIMKIYKKENEGIYIII